MPLRFTLRSSAALLGYTAALALWAATACAEICPTFTPLTLTCGDGHCGLFEDTTSCPLDCLDHSDHALGYYAAYAHCPAARVLHPETVEGVQSAVRELVASNLHVKLMGSGHSSAGNFCSDGGVIVTDRLRRISEIEEHDGRATVLIEAGVSFTELTRHLAARGKWLGHTVVGFGPINVVGGIATGVHGSHTHGVAALASRVVALDVVRADGTLVTVHAGNVAPDVWRALRANLGALGAVVRARLAVDPLVNMRARSDELAVQRPHTLASLDALTRDCAYVFLMLFPASERWVRFCANPTREPPSHPGLYNALFTPDVSPIELRLFQTAAQAVACTPALEPAFERQALARMGGPALCVPGEGGCTERLRAGVAPGHQVLTIAGFPAQQRPFSQRDYELSVRLEDAPAILEYLEQRFKRSARAMPLVGTVVRIDTATDDTLLGSNAARDGAAPGTRLAHIELPFFYPYGLSEAERAAYSAPYDDVVRHVLARYPSAQLHFGKNTRALLGAPEHLAATATRRARFQAVIDDWDPYGVFANEYLAALGFSWPRHGQPLSRALPADGAPSPLVDSARPFAIRSVSAARCLAMAGDPGLLADGSSFGVYAAETQDCAAALDGSDPRRRFVLEDTASGHYVSTVAADHSYRLHPEDALHSHCLEADPWRGARFAPCDGSASQRFALTRASAGSFQLAPEGARETACLNDVLLGDGVGTAFCSLFGVHDGLLWQLLPGTPREFVRVAGLGGDPDAIAPLRRAGLDPARVSELPLHTLAALGRADQVVYRQQVIDNARRTPAAGLEVCVLNAQGAPITRTDGRPFACATTDTRGTYTLLGLPRDTNVLFATRRKGYLQSAIVARTVYPAFFAQEYTGTAPATAASLALDLDPRTPFSAALGRHPGFGDLSLTVLDETDAPGTRGHGTVEAGDYAGTGSEGATFSIFSPDPQGAFTQPYVSPSATERGGLYYLDRPSNPLFGESELPSTSRTSTVAPYGGALAFHLPAGEYEAEVHSASTTRRCRPGADAWPGSTGERARFRVMEGRMSDVRFYCVADGQARR